MVAHLCVLMQRTSHSAREWKKACIPPSHHLENVKTIGSSSCLYSWSVVQWIFSSWYPYGSLMILYHKTLPCLLWTPVEYELQLMIALSWLLKAVRVYGYIQRASALLTLNKQGQLQWQCEDAPLPALRYLWIHLPLLFPLSSIL